MSVLRIVASIECEGCGCLFKIEIDPADKCDGWSVFDYAKDAVRGSNGIIDWDGKSIFTSVEDDKMLCPNCTDHTVSAGAAHDEV